MKLGRTAQFVLIGVAVGVALPFMLSVCLFGNTLQSFLAAPGPTPGYWSGAPTPVPTQPPTPVQAWTSQTFTSAGGAVFVLWSVLGALGGEALAIRRWREEVNVSPKAWMGAVAGSVVFIGIAICGFVR